MTTANRLGAGFQKMIDRAGRPILVRYFETTIGSVYDDDTTLSQSGNDLWTSGVILPIDSREGSFDSVLVEQGKLINNDSRLFVHGSLSMTGSELKVSVQIGSPTGDRFSIIPDGTIAAEVGGVQIYRKVFLRKLTLGSLIGE